MRKSRGLTVLEALVTASLDLQARSVAEAGLENARAKLEKDLGFPPLTDPVQKTFTYSENLTSLDGATVVGRYLVTIDLSSKSRNEIIKITSVGYVGDKAETRRTLYAEIDVSGDIISNANFFRVLNLQDRGGL